VKAYEIRNWSDSEIQQKIQDSYHELFNLRFQHTIGQAKDTSRFKVIKRDIARMKTILNERKLTTQ